MNFNIGKIISGLINPDYLPKRIQGAEQNKVGGFAPEINAGLSNSRPGQGIMPNIGDISNLTGIHTMNAFAGGDRALYIKTLLGLPPNLSTILTSLQNPNKPLMGGLDVGNLNPMFLQNQKVLSEIFKEMNPVAQNTQEAINILNSQTQAAKTNSDAVALMFSGMISLPDISKIILQNSKQAVAALVISMASAAKNGMDGKEIQETLKIINSCIAMAESDNPAQSLKSLMMLYLPWLPLNEGIGFDLEITPPDGENDSNNSKLTVLIQTKNYGNLKGIFTLSTSNSVDIFIVCSDKFPKNTLLKNLMTESSSHAMNTNIDIEETKPASDEHNETHETKVNLSATNEMNPYLLLMAHAFIRYTIMIDNEGLISENSVSDSEL